jgi:hypothetical protein
MPKRSIDELYRTTNILPGMNVRRNIEIYENQKTLAN